MKISTKRKRGCRTRERERERENDDDKRYIMWNEYTSIARSLKTGVEPIWFEIMPCASIYSVLRSTLEVSRVFQRNLEYTSIFYTKT